MSHDGPAHRRTFRTTLTLWWTAGFGLLLAAASTAVYAAFASYLDRDLDLKVRTVAATELGSSTDGATVHLHELPMDALARGEYTEKFVQIFDATGRLHLSSAVLIGAPALVPAEVVEAALAGQAPLVSVVVGGRPGRAAVLRTRKGPDTYRGTGRRLSGSDRCPSGAAGLGAAERLGGRSRGHLSARLLAGLARARSGRGHHASRRAHRAG